jgi:hypothetical protein
MKARDILMGPPVHRARVAIPVSLPLAPAVSERIAAAAMSGDGADTPPGRPDAMQTLAGRTGHIVCAFADASARERACVALQATEFHAADLTRLDARQMGERLIEESKRRDADSGAWGGQLDLELRWLNAASSEQAWLLVRASSDRQALVAQLLLRHEHAGRAVQFGPMWIEDPDPGG